MPDPEPEELRTMKEDPFAGLDLAWLKDESPQAAGTPLSEKQAPVAQSSVLDEDEKDALDWLLQQVARPLSQDSTVPPSPLTPSEADE